LSSRPDSRQKLPWNQSLNSILPYERKRITFVYLLTRRACSLESAKTSKGFC